MPKIETPEEFAQTIKDNAFDPRCWIPSEEVPTGYFDIKEAAQIIAARDTAIRSECAELLKMCGDKIEQALQEVKAIETYDAACTLTEALDALRETGVI